MTTLHDTFLGAHAGIERRIIEFWQKNTDSEPPHGGCYTTEPDQDGVTLSYRDNAGDHYYIDFPAAAFDADFAVAARELRAFRAEEHRREEARKARMRAEEDQMERGEYERLHAKYGGEKP